MKRKQRSIMSRIRNAVAMGIVVLVVVVEAASALSIQNALVKDTKNEIALEASGENRYIESWLSKKVEETELISKSVPGMGKFTDQEMQDYLTQCAAIDSDVLNYYLCREGISYVIYNGGIFDLDPTGRSWWTTAWNAGETIITDAYVDANTGAIVVSIATPFYLNGVRSIVLADITIDAMVETLQNLDDEQLSVVLAGSDGSIIVHKNADYCMQADGSATNVSDLYQMDLTAKEVQIMKDENGAKNYISLSVIESTGWVLGVYLADSYTASRITKAVIFGVIVAFVVGIVGIVYLAMLLKKQLAPLGEMKTFVKEVVVGRSNVKEYHDEKDEIAFLIKELKEKFLKTIRKTKDEMNSIEGDIQLTNSSVVEIVDAVSNISAVIQETAASMDTQTNHISRISEDCAVISNASIAVANQAQEMATKSSEIVARIDELTPKMQAQRQESNRRCNESQEKLNAAIEEAECINEITSISDAIRSIASQTNLLSLNASIESARAGEAGRGFAVVAQEIRSLSDETNKEINKISDLADRLLQAVKTLSQESTDSMNNLSKDIEEAYETVNLLSDEYVESARYYSSISAELGANSEELSASVQTVASAVEDISTSQQDVNTAMENASQGIQVVAMDASTMKDKMDSVSTAVEEVSSTVQQFNV